MYQKCNQLLNTHATHLKMSHRFAAHVPQFRTMLACMCQVYLKAAVLARALNSVRVMIKLEMIMLVEM